MDQRKTVLLADAGEEFRTLLREEMEKTGEFSVEIARDGNEILKRVKERMPDLLVMDVMLPGMDGISVLRQLQKQGDAPMTILVSGFVSDRMLAEASELGAAYFLPKPFETAALLGRCRRASVTRVDSTVSDADTFFPDLDALPNWKIERTGEAVTENGLTYRFVDYVNTALL